ncbi:hypothetical protein KR054_006923, partial [Drosophila jambulina]
IDGKGAVTRGCLATGTNCPDSNCQTCNSDKCNTNGACYSCSGDSCNSGLPANVYVCATNSSKCFTTGTSATNMTRGCTSDAAAKCPVDTKDPSCAICDSSLCNSLAYQRSEGSCVTCTGCSEAQDTSKAAACNVLYNETFASTGCYSTTAGARGCVSALEGGCTDATLCKSCTTDNCNTAAGEFQCYSCLSNAVSGCWDGTGTAIPTVACSNGTCFSGVWNGLGVRDCLTAGSDLMQYQCMNKIQCSTCTTSLCNKVSLNGAGSLSQMGVVGLLLGLMLVLRSA